MTTDPTTPTEKPCTRCREMKPLEDFHVCKANPDGRARWCKLCFISHRKALSAVVRAQYLARKAEREVVIEGRRRAKEASRELVQRLEGSS